MIIIDTCPECGHDLINIMIATYPPIPKKECWNCGWSWTGEPEEVVRMTFSNKSNIESNSSSLNDYINLNNFGDSPYIRVAKGNLLNNKIGILRGKK